MKYLGPAVFLLCCLRALQPCFGQTINLDSLWTVWNDKAQPDTNSLKAMHRIAWNGYLFSQPDSAFYFAGFEYELAEAAGSNNSMALALNTLGVASGIMGNYDKAEHALPLNLYPNPVASYLIIETEHPSTLNLYNTQGQLLLDQEISATYTLNTSGLSRGIYLLNAMDEQRRVYSQKIIKE